MEKRIFTDEQKADIKEMVNNGCTYKEVCDKYCCSVTTLYKVLGIYDARRNSVQPKYAKRNQKKSIICLKCNHSNPAGSKYCNQCGTLLKTKEQLIVDDLLKVRGGGIAISAR